MRTLLRVVLLIVVWGLLAGWGSPAAAQARQTRRIWGSRPLLPYVGLTASLEAPLRRGARLSPVEYAALRRIAWDESQAYRRLLASTAPIISNPTLDLQQKRGLIAAMGYNAQVARLAYTHDLALRRALGRDAYARVAAWTEEQFGVWSAEFGVQSQLGAWSQGFGVLSKFENLPAGGGVLTANTTLRTPHNSPRSYKIYATRYDAKGRYTAALPDRCVKLTNGGSSTCAEHGYVAGQVYSIIMSYKDTVGVDVGETGPWNIDDTFWATAGDPTPRRMFADLALGMPEAQAAFYNGYNGGADQYGRKVTAPFAIDLAFEVADDLGLPPKSNDWITVSFMWTEAWGAGGGGAGGGSAAVEPVETAAADASGKVVHVVKSGQTLWNIAVSYDVTVDALKALNGLGEDGLIVSGQKLLVRAGDEPAASTPQTTAAQTPTPGKAARATQRAAQRGEAARGLAATESAAHIARAGAATAALLATHPSEPARIGALLPAAHADPILLAIIAAVILGLGLVAWGTIIRRE